MFDSKTPLYEGVWKIEDVSTVNDEMILVNFITGFFETKEEAEDPECLEPYDTGPSGKSVQTVKLESKRLPSITEYNSGSRHKLYEILTEELELKVKKN